jgi:uncharacterized protein YcgI (DUF1989 family)
VTGRHDTFMAAYCWHPYTLLGCARVSPQLPGQHVRGMQAFGLTVPKPIRVSFNIFMNIAVQPDGINLDTRPIVTKAGDSITLWAEMDYYVALSACPQDIVKIQGAGENVSRKVELEIMRWRVAELEGARRLGAGGMRGARCRSVRKSRPGSGSILPNDKPPTSDECSA